MPEASYAYPEARRDEIVDDYHGTPVADPYRWLEDPASAESRAWTEQENALTREFLDVEPRERILERLKSLCAYSRWSTPFRRGQRLFFWKNEGLQNQPVLYWLDESTQNSDMLLDPNTINSQGIVSVVSVDPTPDGQWLAYSLSQRGSDWQEVRIRNVATGQDLPEILIHTKFAGIAWLPDGSGFYYNRYPDPATVADGDQNYYNAVYWHQLNTDQSEDTLVYERPDEKDFDFWPKVSDDGKFLILTVHLGTDRRNRVYYRRLDGDGEFVRLLDQAEAQYRFIGNQSDDQGERLFFFSDRQAPRGRVIAIDLAQPEPQHWQTLLPEGEDVLTHVVFAGGRFVAVTLHHARHRIQVHGLDGSLQDEISLPTLGSVDELNARCEDDEIFIGFSSFLFPARSYRYHLASKELKVQFSSEIDFDPEAYITRQAFFTSKDGTKVPMFLVHRKDLEMSPETPTLMYGYGGFRHAMTPTFTASLLPWLEQGGLYCLVNLRGGSEYGTEWYQQGTLERKQNVFDDFIHAGKYLIAEGLTSPAKLAIRGGSNGGLLVGACVLQAPELFGAVVCQVPVLDMLRYHRFTIGRYWVSDYGNGEENPEHFEFLIKYSPLHNVRAGSSYPPILITSADHDDRVVPAHAKKFAATLQAETPQNLALLRVDTDAGHGRGKPLSKVIEEMSDIYTFLARTLKIDWV
jgi:prolyl oligopeptidase